MNKVYVSCQNDAEQLNDILSTSAIAIKKNKIKNFRLYFMAVNCFLYLIIVTI